MVNIVYLSYAIVYIVSYIHIFDIIYVADPGEDMFQTNCNIISTNLPTVTGAGGVIANGTQNVILYCICNRSNVAAGPTYWYFNDAPVTLSESDETDGNPYYRNNVPSPLIIPSFVAPHDGTYSCVRSANLSDVSRVDITLTLPGIQ